MDWLKNLNNAIDYIENNLDKEISYEEAARIACCSTYYFQRMFSYVAGISLSEYIRRRRMSQAAFELQRTDKTVLEVALKYGYTSPTSFNRAFQRVHGINPITAKKKGITLNAYPPIQFSVKITGGSAMAYHIADKEAIRIVGIRTRLTENIEENQINIPIFWKDTLQSKRFMDICELSNRNPNGILGISVYQDPENIFYYIAAATTKEIPIGMYECEIPAATWVIFENDGPFKETVQTIFQRFYTEWLPFSGYEYAGLPDIEIYPIVKGNPLNGHSEVWISIKEKNN
ncbi:MAG TPA: AraC family transcriptional regulator [Candidatus Fimimorpha faecalis]|uniref:AraC family transcriptional regulator n=1 Tax=Candidatus Fimimorpha faecalis TaxID=2840824 RepID=A0A9D1EE60_9FIRM|nr:AraC family transcriptional regulator [Candidatus Fimimorpha faecalis]